MRGFFYIYNMTSKYLANGYFLALFVSLFLPGFGSIDKMSTIYLGFSVSNFLAFLLIPFCIKNSEIKFTLKSPVFYFYLTFIVFSIISMLNAINIVESIVRLNQIFTFFSSLFLVLLFSKNKMISLNFLLSIISISLVIDLGASLYQYYKITEAGFTFSFQYSDLVRGISSNKNILAASLLFRLPFIIMLAIKIKNNFFYIITFIVSSLVFFDLYLLASRAIYLSIFLSLILISISLFYLRISSAFKLKKIKNILIFIILPILTAYFIFNITIDKSDEVNITNRIESINDSQDQSVKERMLFYTSAIKYISKNPFIGCGVGNWKIKSIELVSENLKSYIVPYNAHNDFLEVFAESGIFAFLAFVFFFISIIRVYFKKSSLKYRLQNNYETLILLLIPVVTYFIDLNLNFPSTRPYMIFCLLMFISVIHLLEKNEV